MIIGDINTENRVLIIAEIGNNHEGNFDVACKLVEEAASCGVDAVKFQTFKADLFINKNDEERYKRYKSFELSYSQFQKISDLAHSKGLLFISTPLDLESAHFLDSIVDAFKIASGDITFIPLLEFCSGTGKPIILSTGACEPQQVNHAISVIEKGSGQNVNSDNMAILHCVSCYPTPVNQANLGSIEYLAERYPFTIGYSDHTIGIDVPVFSVCCGARIVEKHFTLDKSYSSFRDHQLSSDPEEMKELVKKIRALATIIGEDTKEIQPCEKENLSAIRRSIVAKRNMKAGHKIILSDLMWIRPSGGLLPGKEKMIVGKKLRKNVLKYDQITEQDLE